MTSAVESQLQQWIIHRAKSFEDSHGNIKHSDNDIQQLLHNLYIQKDKDFTDLTCHAIISSYNRKLQGALLNRLLYNLCFH
ncbi:Domain of unknown function DUF3386 [Orpheovirus IHUMI-LCC2]|uniref:Uncharacterized protein n=1 Tax=Orpheovirus IHUMI-LCC2 TaxID=2023057 RepID=A0A2I2L413_9VIRU|nr:Domain of unknown function DUF3386 [Orpheovirus IHUMI-LCC2]SNW62268.1 Domain of unknown function DUF3386 [Orpheovirus IHUMI-LCC2]